MSARLRVEGQLCCTHVADTGLKLCRANTPHTLYIASVASYSNGWSHIYLLNRPATGIKVRLSGQAVKLEMIKQSRCPFAQLKSRSG